MDANQDMIQVTSNADSALANGKDTEEQIMQGTKGMAYGVIECTNANGRAVDCSDFACAYPKGSVVATRAPKVRPPPPFLLKVYDMVQNPEFDSTISWGAAGTSFIIWDAHKFAAEVLTKYFKHNNFTSFICQLNTYCFKKINWERLEFQNEWFQKGKKRWLKYIKRRNQITKHIPQSQGVEPAVELALAPSEMKKELEHMRQQQTDLKVEIAKLKEIQEKQEEEMDTLHKRGQRAVSKRRKIVQLMNQAVVKLKRELYGAEGSQKLRLEGEKGIDSLVELADSEDISKASQQSSPSIQSNTKNTCLAVDSGTDVQEKGKNTASVAILLDANASEYTLLEKQLLEDLNGENLTEEELAKFHPSLVIGMEDLIAGPADWMEFSKELTHKAKSLKSNCKIENLSYFSP